MIELRGIDKSYKLGTDAFQALAGVDLDLRPGEFVALTGPSGSGKSTLMNILGCLDTPSAGSYVLDGEPAQEIMALFTELNSEGHTLVIVTHDPGIASYCKRVIRLHDGRIVEDRQQAPFEQPATMAH